MATYMQEMHGAQREKIVLLHMLPYRICWQRITDQPKHSPSLTRVFVARLQNR